MEWIWRVVIGIMGAMIGYFVGILRVLSDESGKPSKLKPHCCKIGCKKRAIWEMWYGKTPDDYTHSCNKHIGDLMTNAPEHRISPIVMP